MRRMIIGCTAALTALAFSTAAFAQMPRGPQPPSRPNTSSYRPDFSVNNGFRDARDLERHRADLTRQQEEERSANPERAVLADRIAAMVQAGQCAEARTAANEAGDRQMALRVRQTCRAR